MGCARAQRGWIHHPLVLSPFPLSPPSRFSGLGTELTGWVALDVAVYRTNSYPFVHLNIWHALMNILSLTSLLERFESEHGTLTSLALFFGRESLYLAI